MDNSVKLTQIVPVVKHHRLSHFCPSTSYVYPVCHICPPHHALLLCVSGVLLQPYLCRHTQYPSWDTKPMIRHSSVPLSTFVTFISTFFVRLTSVCMSYPKLNPHLKWKSCLCPNGYKALWGITIISVVPWRISWWCCPFHRGFNINVEFRGHAPFDSPVVLKIWEGMQESGQNKRKMRLKLTAMHSRIKFFSSCFSLLLFFIENGFHASKLYTA